MRQVKLLLRIVGVAILFGVLFFLAFQKTSLVSAQGTGNQSFDAAKLEKYLTVEAALLGQNDNVSLYFKDETTGKDISINSVSSQIPASTIKAFAAVEAFRQRDLGLINFGDTVTIQAQNVVPTELETDEFPRLREGTQATIQQLVEAMVIQSDNTAYNTLLDILDRRNINTTLRNLGITQTVVGEKLNLDDDQFQTDLQVPGRQPNTITAKDLATLFDLLYVNKISSSNEMLAIFKRQKLNNMIPALLPPDIIVAHKTGDWAPIYHDGGIVYKPNDPFILTVFTNGNDPNVVAQLARVAYYRTAEVVGENIQNPTTKPQADDTRDEHIYLAEAPPQETNVLAAQTTSSGERTYVVAPGDTLWSIAQIQYGSGFAYTSIIDRNAIQDPGNITTGTTLILPFLAGTPFTQTEQAPTINAADIGVTDSDLHVGKAQTTAIGSAWILPGSPFYVVKQWLEKQSVDNAPTVDAKVDALLVTSRKRLAEIQRELSFDNVAAVQPLLSQSEDALRQAVNLAQSASNNDVVLFRIRQHLDAHFEVLNEATHNIGNTQKEAYIDALYAFYQKQKTDLQPAIASALVANPLQQKPTIGTVTEVQNNIASVKTDDGKTVQVALTHLTPSRSVDQTTVEIAAPLTPGEKIAVVGQVTPQSVVTPQFILRNVPAQLPVGHTGKVIEIDPKENKVKIQDTMGKIDTINITEATKVKSRDTNVDIAGIKAGSMITVVGTLVQPTVSSNQKPTVGTGIPTTTVNPSGTPSTSPSSAGTPGPTSGAPTSSGTPTISPSSTGVATHGVPSQNIPGGSKTTITVAPAPSPVVFPHPGSIESVPGAPPTAKPGQTVNASTVTVNKNASGKNERVVGPSKPSNQGKPSSGGQKSQVPQAAPPPRKKP